MVAVDEWEGLSPHKRATLLGCWSIRSPLKLPSRIQRTPEAFSGV